MTEPIDKQVERVARAIARERGYDPDSLYASGEPLWLYVPGGGYQLPLHGLAVWRAFERDARAAVTALATPWQAVTPAGAS